MLQLKKDLDKSSGMRLSDWSKDILSQDQQKYAATDAYVSYIEANLQNCIQIRGLFSLFISRLVVSRIQNLS